MDEETYSMDEETYKRYWEEQKRKDRKEELRKTAREWFMGGTVVGGIILFFYGANLGREEGIHEAKLATMKYWETELISIHGFDRGYALSKEVKDRMWNSEWYNYTHKEELSVLGAD